VSNLPVLTYSTKGLPEDRAFAEWQSAMAPLFHVEPARFRERLPRGSTKSILIGDIIANRSVFTAQHLSRDAALIAATPGPLLLQAYISGGFHGELAGQTVTVGKGMVAVTDLRRTVDVRAASSNTVGLALPRSLAAQLDEAALIQGLDAARNRQLAAWIVGLYRRLPRMRESDVPALTQEITTFLERLCAGVPCRGGQAPDADQTLLIRAEALIRSALASPDLSPEWLGDRLGVSRSALYRLYAPLGGVRRQIQEQRLLAVYEALSDPLEPRGLGQVAVDHGFSSAALFNRNFRKRFGRTPGAYRADIIATSEAVRPASLEPVQSWWSRLGS
jgi:AraC-like DNA-binding protein